MRLIHGVHDSTRFQDKSWGCDLYMDATYTRVITVSGFVDVKHARGRQRERFLTYLGKFTNKPPMELLRLAKDRVAWSKLCAE